MWWNTLLVLTTVLVVSTAQHAILENTIENDLQQRDDLDQHEGDSTRTSENDEVQINTNNPIETTTEDNTNNLIETTTEANKDNTNSPIETTTDDNKDTTTTELVETVSSPETNHGTATVSEPELESTTQDQDIVFQESKETDVYSNEFISVVPTGTYDSNVVETTSGPVRRLQWRENPNIISYIDIPYGDFKEPFQAPVLAEPISTILENQEHSKRCPQLYNDEYVGDMDCLTLSIFTPVDVKNASVLFHIHDGQFISGSGDPAIYGPDYLVSQGVILVLPNYRLGPLGFLCLQNSIAPGNAALKDLTLALNWVKENIANFGGDPNNIAVSGDGISGALAGYLAISPQSKNFVDKVITESGSVLSHWALDRYPLINGIEFMDKIKNLSLVDDLDIQAILTAAKGIEFKPCIENNTDGFMIDTPWTMIHNEGINITFMIGAAMYAGAQEALLQSEDSINKINEDYTLLLPNDLKFQNVKQKSDVAKRVKTQYFNENPITLDNITCLALCFTDSAYLGPAIRTARPLVEAGAQVYMYEFSFVGEFNRELVSINKSVEGAVRGDIIGYLFTQDGKVPDEETIEARMMKVLVDLWINFIQTGDPSTENIVWNKLDTTSATDEEWLSIGTDVTMMKGIHVDRLNLWTEIYNDHFIEHNTGYELSSSVYTVLIAQLVFWIGFFKNISHLY